jgi:hypothetical protein
MSQTPPTLAIFPFSPNPFPSPPLWDYFDSASSLSLMGSLFHHPHLQILPILEATYLPDFIKTLKNKII